MYKKRTLINNHNYDNDVNTYLPMMLYSSRLQVPSVNMSQLPETYEYINY
jgi:hypothetical protein